MILTTPDTVTAIKFLPYKLLGTVCSSQYKVERVEINDDRKQLRVQAEPASDTADNGDPVEADEQVEVQAEANVPEGEPSEPVPDLDAQGEEEEPTVPVPTAREAVSIPLIKFTYTK